MMPGHSTAPDTGAERSAVGEPDFDAIMSMVISAVLEDPALSFPWYQPRIFSEAQAAAADPPLVYSWNERVRDGRLQSFSVSVNGGRLAAMLTPHLPRWHPAFVSVRDRLTALLAEAQNRTLIRLCTEFAATPSQLSRHFAEHPALLKRR
jgi:hypothetical protein